LDAGSAEGNAARESGLAVPKKTLLPPADSLDPVDVGEPYAESDAPITTVISPPANGVVVSIAAPAKKKKANVSPKELAKRVTAKRFVDLVKRDLDAGADPIQAQRDAAEAVGTSLGAVARDTAIQTQIKKLLKEYGKIDGDLLEKVVTAKRVEILLTGGEGLPGDPKLTLEAAKQLAPAKTPLVEMNFGAKADPEFDAWLDAVCPVKE
jgi:hypothetical protein